MSYEVAFKGFKFSTKSDNISKYALWKSLIVFKGNREKLARWKRQLYHQRISSRGDIDNSIKEFIDQLRREKHPAKVDLKDGWQPQQARFFLADRNLETAHYESLGTELYSASSLPLDLDNEVLSSNVTFHIYGTRDIVNCLKLRLDVNYKITEKDAIGKLLEVAELLNRNALGAELPSKIRNAFYCKRSASVFLKGKLLTVSFEEWPESVFGEFEVTYKISTPD